jgi:hypothetical protein
MKLYIHNSGCDIAFEIISKTVDEDGKYEMTVMWYNVGPHKPFCMNILQSIVIDKKKFEEEWHEYRPRSRKYAL